MNKKGFNSKIDRVFLHGKKTSYASLAMAFVGFFSASELNGEIQWYDIDPDDAFVSHDEAIFTGGNGGYVIDIDKPDNNSDLNDAEVLLKIVSNAYFGVTSDFGVVIDQQFEELLKARFMGSVALYEYPTVMPTFTSVYAQAAKLEQSDMIGPTNLDVEGRLVGSTGFVNRNNGTSGAFVKLASGNGGQWMEGTGFLGVKFEIEENTYYGWVELEVVGGSVSHGDNSKNFNFTVKSFAYEDCPNVPIRMGEKSVSLCDNVSIDVHNDVINTLKVYPNPASKKSLVEFTASNSTKLTIELLEFDGKHVKFLFDEYIEEGSRYSIEIGADELNNGIYFIKFVARQEKFMAKKMYISH